MSSLHATAIPLLSTAMGRPLHFTIKAIQTLVDSLRVDIFPKGEDFSVRAETLHATAIPLLSTAMGRPLHFSTIAIQALVDYLRVDIFPNGEDFSVRSETPRYTNVHALDAGASIYLAGAL